MLAANRSNWNTQSHNTRAAFRKKECTQECKVVSWVSFAIVLTWNSPSLLASHLEAIIGYKTAVQDTGMAPFSCQRRLENRRGVWRRARIRHLPVWKWGKNGGQSTRLFIILLLVLIQLVWSTNCDGKEIYFAVLLFSFPPDEPSQQTAQKLTRSRLSCQWYGFELVHGFTSCHNLTPFVKSLFEINS